MIELTSLDLINEYIFITLLTRDAWGVRLCVCVSVYVCKGGGRRGYHKAVAPISAAQS